MNDDVLRNEYRLMCEDCLKQKPSLRLDEYELEFVRLIKRALEKGQPLVPREVEMLENIWDKATI